MRPAHTCGMLVYAFLGVVCLCQVATASEASRLIEISLETDLVPSPVEVGVLLPPGYSPDGDEFPLMLMLHGGNGSSKDLTWLRAGFDDAWAAGALPALVVVMPSAQRSFYMDYRDGSQLWETFIVRELLPEVRRKFHVAAGREGTMVTGGSMGGMGGLRIAFKHPQTFEAVAVLMPALEPVFRYEDIDPPPSDSTNRSIALYEEIFGDPVDPAYWQQNHPLFIAKTKVAELRASGLEVYLECGDEDQNSRAAEILHRILFDGGLKHEYRLVRGAGHGGPSMPGRLRNMLEYVGRALAPSEPTASE